MREMKIRVVVAVGRRLAAFSHAARVLALALASSFWLPTIASASILASETFESYSAGPLSGQGGGTGWTGNWTAPGDVTRAEVVDTTGNPLAFTPGGGLPIEGATRALEVALTGAPTSQLCGVRTLASPISQTFYVGYLVRHVAGVWAGANNTFTLHLGTSSSSTTTLNFGLRGNTAAGSDEFVIRYATAGPVAGASTGGQLVTGTDYYLVAKVTHSGAAFTSASLWLNPSAADEVDTPNGDAALTGFSSLPITHVFFRQAVLDADDILRADEIRMGTDWSDVVPPAKENTPPSVTLTNPASGATFQSPATVLLSAIASDSDGSVTNVAFYAGAAKLGEEASPPYHFVWTNVTAGAYTLTARATDNEGSVGISPGVTISVLDTNTNGVVTGELKKWHKVTITWQGPDTSETNANNPFRNYRLNVTFTHPASGRSYLVPGFFAADGDAANTSAESGDQWRVHFAPDETGRWNYRASCRAGADVALSSSPTAGAPGDFDGAGGSFVIEPTDKTGRDHRGKGRLQYVGKHHLRFAETGEYFLKMGADSPENLLSYEDFDETPNVNNQRKSWSPHAGEYDATDAGEFTWAGGQGTELLGAIRYLSDKGLNAFSFIPFTLDGDDKNVFPQRLVSTAAAFQSAAQPRWTKNVVYHDRFDVSKLEQWDRIFAYGDKKGMYLHFKTLETENELTMDGGNLGPERMLYYRELIARFGYHLALNWNLGEEIDNASTAQKQSWSQYFYDTDPYHHHQVIHNGASHYDLLGSESHLTGFSRQTSPGSIFASTLDYLKRSDDAGVPWVVAYDEQNSANDGIKPDADDATHDSVRGNVIWSHLLAGGAGVESYFGYGWAHSDLNCQDFRSRDNWWDQCRYALEFFRSNAIPFQNMTNRDSLLTGVSSTHCFARTGQVYVAYLPTNGAPNLDLNGVSGDFSVRWFNPRHGGLMQTGSVAQVTGGGNVSLGSAPQTTTNDWVTLVKRIPPADTTPPSVLITAPTNGASRFANLPLTVSATVTDNVAVAFAELRVDGNLQPPAKTNAPYDFLVSGLSLGGHTLAVIGQDFSANRATNSVSVTFLAPAQPSLSFVSTGGVTQLFWSAPGFALEQANEMSGAWTNLILETAGLFVLTPTNPESYFRLRWRAP